VIFPRNDLFLASENSPNEEKTRTTIQAVNDEEKMEYVKSGRPYRNSKGEVFQNGSKLSLHGGFWWWDAGVAMAPEGAEKNLPLIDLEDKK